MCVVSLWRTTAAMAQLHNSHFGPRFQLFGDGKTSPSTFPRNSLPCDGRAIGEVALSVPGNLQPMMCFALSNVFFFFCRFQVVLPVAWRVAFVSTTAIRWRKRNDKVFDNISIFIFVCFRLTDMDSVIHWHHWYFVILASLWTVCDYRYTVSQTLHLCNS